MNTPKAIVTIGVATANKLTLFLSQNSKINQNVITTKCLPFNNCHGKVFH